MKNQDFLPLDPKKLISLWDMIEFIRWEFGAAHDRVLYCLNRFLSLASKSDQKGTVTSEEKSALLGAVKEAKRQCRQLNLDHSLEIIRQIEQDFFHTSAAPFYQQIGTQFRLLWNAMSSDMSERKFVFIPKENEDYFFNESLFPDSVYDAFPDDHDELNDAGHCMAVDLNDAAAFHLLRIVEIGLRGIARNLKIKIPKTPLDYAGWKDVVNRIDKKLEEKIPKARGPKQVAALKFQQDLLADFKAFEVARNEVMHGRSRYSKPQAIGLFDRVRDFMRRVAVAIIAAPR